MTDMHLKSLFLLTFLFFIFGCEKLPTADLILINGNIATVNTKQIKAEAIAVKADRIIMVGKTKTIEKLKDESTTVIDLKGQFVMPGFIEGHGHYSGLGQSQMNLNFLKSKNWNEIVQMVAEKVKTAEPGEWIYGRGWHQEKWNEVLDKAIHGYPYHDDLSAVSPDNPVLLGHASGHSVFANAKAMEIAGITKETPDPAGGEIVRDGNGQAIGVFEERAQTAIYTVYQEYIKTLPKEKRDARWLKGLRLAEQECLSNGITSFQDAGSSFEEIEKYNQLAETNDLNVRLWAMIRHSYDHMKDKLEPFPIINSGQHFFTSRAIKSEVDGALGAFGAWLLKPYHDKPGFEGQNTTPITEVKNIATLADQHDLQLCVHAIGDRANRIVLDIFENNFGDDLTKDRRWRIEHAQHLDSTDIPRFKKLGVIASMQGIHCTSDAPFVVKRLGRERARIGAYPWRSLLDNGVIIANGTDVPVEDIDPFECFYASVTRKRADTGMEFFPEQRMTREEALHSYTLGNAYAAFEETDKGSLEEGKLADIVVLSNNLLTCSDEDILNTEVLYTIVGGEIKHKK